MLRGLDTSGNSREPTGRQSLSLQGSGPGTQWVQLGVLCCAVLCRMPGACRAAGPWPMSPVASPRLSWFCNRSAGSWLHARPSRGSAREQVVRYQTVPRNPAPHQAPPDLLTSVSPLLFAGLFTGMAMTGKRREEGKERESEFWGSPFKTILGERQEIISPHLTPPTAAEGERRGVQGMVSQGTPPTNPSL